MRTHILVAGGGVIGCSIAWRLAQSAFQVTLLEARRLGAGASTAGAGMLAPGAEISGAGEWSRLALDSLRTYRSFVEELEAESGVSIEHRVCGAVDLAFTQDEWNCLEERAQQQAQIGIHSERLGPSEINEILAAHGPPACLAARLYPADAIVNPHHVMQALETSCRNRGVRIIEGQPLLRLRLQASSVLAESAGSTIQAAAAVLAAGAWSSTIQVEGAPLPPRAFPIRGHLVGYSAAEMPLRLILRHAHTYILQRANGLTIAGSSEEDAGFRDEVDPSIVADIRRRAEALLPGLAAARNVEAWTGFRPAAEGMQPQIRRWEGGPLWLAYGHYRNGILMAPATAERIVREITSSLERA